MKTPARALQKLSPFVRSCGEYELPLRFRREPYSIYEHEFIFVLSGTVGYRIGAETFTLRPHDLLLVPPHVLTASWNSGPVPARFCAVHFDFFYSERYRGLPMRRITAGVRQHPTAALPDVLKLPRKINCRDLPQVRVLLERIIDEMSSQHSEYEIAVKAALLDIFMLIMRRKTGAAVQNRMPQRIMNAVRFMEREYARALRLEDIARSVRLNRVYFERIFKKHMGTTPMKYLMELRIGKARMKLADHTANIQDVALSCGFIDPYHFSKTFHRLVGISPSTFRRTADTTEGVAVQSGQRRLNRKCRLNHGFS